MGSFPEHPFQQADVFFTAYMERLATASKSVDAAAIQQSADLLLKIFAQGGTLYVCGNGGSAAISNHMGCDVMKGIQTDTKLTPRIVSLSSVKENDVLITISSFGNSENIVRAVHAAKTAGIPTIAMTGFDGGRSAKLADINLHVDCDNYGIVEDIHQSLMHVLTQYLRMSGMPVRLICDRKF